MTKKYSPAAQKSVERAVHEMKRGKLKMGRSKKTRAEQKTGDRHWSFGSKKEGGEGSIAEEMNMRLSNIRLKELSDVGRGLLLGTLLIAAIMIAAVGFGRMVDHLPFFIGFDRTLYEAANLAPHPAWLDAIVAPFNFNFLPWGGTFIPSFLYFIFGIGCVYIAARHPNKLVWAFLSLGIAIFINSFLYKITDAYVIRDRPFLHLPNNVSDMAKAIWVHWPTYPSGHVRDMALYSTVLAGWALELRWLFVVLTFWVAYTRLYLGAHYPTDVLAGWAIGYAVGVGILLFMHPLYLYVEKKWAAKKQKTL